MEQNEKTTQNNAADGTATPEVIEAGATVKIEGQEFELDAALAQDDRTLRTILQPHFASVENADITRETKDGRLIVSVVKRAQHKGAECPADILSAEPERINPAITLAEELMRKSADGTVDDEDIRRAEETLQEARVEMETVAVRMMAIVKTPASADTEIPEGF